MASFTLKYNLVGSGWAEALIKNETDSISMTVSYLHDSLCDLADAAKSLMYGADTATVIFMDEPGEHQLVLFKNSNSISYEVRWFDDWASWNMYPPDKYKVGLSGVTTLKRLTGEIFHALEFIFEKYGLETYKDLWGEHEFFTHEFHQLKLLRGTEQTDEPDGKNCVDFR